ncbi:hypothetical protein Tco_1548613 [Tanacetum coccineum]
MPKPKQTVSAFKSMLEKHTTGDKLNDSGYRADAQALAYWVVLFYHHNEVACLMLRTMQRDNPLAIMVMNIQEKDKNRSQIDKTEHENGKSVKEKSKSRPSQKVKVNPGK